MCRRVISSTVRVLSRRWIPLQGHDEDAFDDVVVERTEDLPELTCRHRRATGACLIPLEMKLSRTRILIAMDVESSDYFRMPVSYQSK